MQLIYIPKERINTIKKDRSIIGKVEKLCKCKVTVKGDGTIEVDGEAFGEFLARNIISAFGRGFDINIACKLSNDDYYFKSIDLGPIAGSDKRIEQVKARIIGKNGKTKRYIESVSNANLSIYGESVGFIGRIEEISEAQAAVDTLAEGSTHRLAYIRMETTHRKNKENARNAAF
jgi:ribosomal RNA assembly protein